MGLEFLARVRRSTLWTAAVVLLVLTTYAPWRSALGVAAGVAWSLANLALLERLVVAVTSRGQERLAMAKRAGLAGLATLLLFAAGGMLLVLLPPMLLLAGFALPLGVLVLKAASSLLLESPAWKWLTASPWRAGLAVAAILVAAWWAVPAKVLSQAEPATTTEAGAPAGEHAAGDATAEHGAEAAEGEHAAEEGTPKFPSVVGIIAKANHGQPWADFLHHFEVQVYALLVAALICLIAFLATRNAQLIPGPLQNVVEMLVGSLHDFIVGILGDHHGRRFVPFLGTLFIYIWFMNLFGLIPFMESPTANLNTTFALAITVFLYCQWVGLRALGPLGYVDHLMGSPRDLTGWLLVPLMLPIHILGELAKPISLSCRLFGNIFGEDMLLVAFVSLGVTTLAFLNLPLGLPLHLPFLFLALLTSTLQALVFTVLSTIYLLLMLPHDDHGHEAEAQHAHSH